MPRNIYRRMSKKVTSPNIAQILLRVPAVQRDALHDILLRFPELSSVCELMLTKKAEIAIHGNADAVDDMYAFEQKTIERILSATSF